MKEGTRQLVAFLFLLGAATLGSLTYVIHYWYFFSQVRSFLPDLVSGLIAIALLRPLLVGDFHHNHRANLTTWVNLALLFYVTSIFANIGLGGDTSWLKTLSSIVAIMVIGMANLNCHRHGQLVVPILLLFGAINNGRYPTLHVTPPHQHADHKDRHHQQTECDGTGHAEKHPCPSPACIDRAQMFDASVIGPGHVFDIDLGQQFGVLGLGCEGGQHGCLCPHCARQQAAPFAQLFL